MSEIQRDLPIQPSINGKKIKTKFHFFPLALINKRAQQFSILGKFSLILSATHHNLQNHILKKRKNIESKYSLQRRVDLQSEYRAIVY